MSICGKSEIRISKPETKWRGKLEIRNSKPETKWRGKLESRNPKSETNPKFETRNRRVDIGCRSGLRRLGPFCSLDYFKSQISNLKSQISNLKFQISNFRICFGFRYSNFGFSPPFCFALVVFSLLFTSNRQTVVADDEPPQLAVYVMNSDGEGLRKVAQAADRKWHAAPCWSSDGKLVLFHAHLKDAQTADSHIFVCHDDGSDIKDLGAGAYASWSPDNKQIVFSIPDQHVDKGQAGVWIMNADGKGRQWLFAGTSPRYAPDGSRILFVSSHEGNQSIYVYDVIEGMPKKHLQEPYQKRPGSACWSPDGKRVAFVDDRTGKSELILIDATGSEKKQVVRFRGLIGGPAAWAPYGRIALWVKAKELTDPQRLHMLDPDSEDSPVLLSQQGEGTLNFDPAWSSDGQRILFVSDRVIK
jgi:Tol biopolymer transport system component